MTAGLMRRHRSFWVMTVLVIVAACSSPQVGYDFDRGADFNRYRTYAWLSAAQQTTGDKRLDSSLVNARIRAAVDAQLRMKGYLASQNGPPDFLIAYHAGMKDLMKGASTQNYIGDRAHGTFTTISDVQPYHEGTLTIDIVDAASRQLIWQASATADVEQGLSPEERDSRIKNVVRAMLAHFPPQ